MMKYDTSRLTPRMVRCLERADEIADSYGREYTGVEHVVMSVFFDSDAVPTRVAEQTGALGVLLFELDSVCRTGELRAEATRLAPESAPPPSPTGSK